MANISKTNNLSAQYKTGGKLKMLLLILLAICTFSQRLQADTSIYVFGPDQSMVIKTGGFAGVHITYAVTGQFRLTVDSDSGVASFEIVDANLTDEVGLLYGQSLDEIFNMTGLAGTIVDDTTIQFEGKTADGTESDVSLKLTFSKGPAHLTGKTSPPPNTADMFFYDVNAVATKKYAGGTGEPNDPYQIATSEDLMMLGESPNDYDKHFILTADIDLDPNLPGRKIFDRAVIAPDTNDKEDWFQGRPFTGVFDGNGHAISHLTILGESCVGLFGQLDTAEIMHLRVVDVNVASSGGYVGALVGSNGGHVIHCNSAGSVSGSSWSVGGLVGINEPYGSVTASYSTGTVSGGTGVGGLVGGNACRAGITCSYSACAVMGDDYVGGLVGDNDGGAGHWGFVGNSYSTGMVMGTGECVGGLMGVNWGHVTHCYSVGAISNAADSGGSIGSNGSVQEGWGTVTDCFWDIQTSGRTTSAAGEGLTTTEMQTAGTFLDAGWDFVGETDNGTEDIWSICEGTNYPRFVWQIPVGDFVCPDGITIDDFSFFMEYWLDDNCDLSNGYCQGTDLDQSGTVDVNDLEIFFELWSAE